MSASAAAARHRVLIVGGGFGGLRAAKALSQLPLDVTLVDRTNHHLFQPLLYQVATGLLSPGQVAPTLRTIFRDAPSVRTLLAEVTDVDLDRRVVRAVAQRELELPYDTLIVAAGSTDSYFGHDEWAQDALAMKTLDDATRLRSRILAAFEMAEGAQDAAERDRWLTFALVGAGPTGVELAGQIATLANRILPGEYRSIDPSRAKIILLDGLPTVLSAFAKSLQERAQRDLRDLGVELQLGAKAVNVDQDGIDVEDADGGRRIEAKTVIWSAGVQASPLAGVLAERAGVEPGHGGRLKVASDLSLPGHPEVFAIGDMVTLQDVPGMAQPAIQQGRYVATVIERRLAGAPAPSAFKYRDLGSMATIGRTRAIADIHGLKLAGLPAFLIWGGVHIAYLVGWGNRIDALGRWAWSLFGRARRERLISAVSVVPDEVAEAEIDRWRHRAPGTT
jgi:NADH:ubiquinone reductase (H+-translocating)